MVAVKRFKGKSGQEENKCQQRKRQPRKRSTKSQARNILAEK
jgi:hypothetical protein